MRVAVTILTAGLIQVAAIPALGEQNGSTQNGQTQNGQTQNGQTKSAEAIVADHMDRLTIDEAEAVVVDHAASRVVTTDEPETGIVPADPGRAPVKSRLVRRYRVDADGRRHVEYDAGEREVRRSTARRVRDYDHDHRHAALDGLAVGLALGLPYVAYHNYDRHYRHGYRSDRRGYRSSRHGYRGHARAHRKHQRHHRRWW